MTLRSYLTLVMSTLIVLMMLGFGIYATHEQDAFAAGRHGVEYTTITRSVAASVADEGLSGAVGRSGALQALLGRYSNLPDLRELVVYDGGGYPLAALRRTDDDRLLQSAEAVSALDPAWLAGQVATQGAPSLRERTWAIVVELPVGQGAGWVRLVSDLGSLREAREHMIRDSVTIGALFACLMAICVYVLLGGPTNALHAATTFAATLPRVRNERLNVPRWPREFRELGVSLNQMAEELAQQHKVVRASEARKTAVLESALDGVITIDDAGRVVDFNPAAEAMFGYVREEVVGREMAALIVPPAYREAHREGMRRYAQSGHGPVLRKRLEIVAMRSNGDEFPIELAIVPVQVDGRALFSATVRDISDVRAMTQEREALLGRLQGVVDELEHQKLALDLHAIVCTVDAAWRIVYANERMVSVCGQDDAVLPGRELGSILSGFDASVRAGVIDTLGRSTGWHGEVRASRADGAPIWLACTVMSVPRREDRQERHILIATNITAQKQAEESVARLHRSEVALGAHVQRNLLVCELPTNPGDLSVSAFGEASQGIDGDFYELISNADGSLDVIVGDVMGKGMSAALLGAAVKMSLSRAISEQTSLRPPGGGLPRPGQIVGALARRLTPHLQALGSFVTMAYYRIDAERRHATYVGLGHTEALLVDPARGQHRFLPNQFPPLGVLDEMTVHESTVSLEYGMSLLLYSDGITEATAPLGEQFGTQRLVEVVREAVGRHRRAPVALQILRREIGRFQAGSTRQDDLTAVLVGIGRQGDADALGFGTVELQPDLGEITRLRRVLAAGTDFPHVDESDRHAIELGAVEVFTNIVRHGRQGLQGAPVVVTGEVAAGHVHLIFESFGEAYDPPATPQPDCSGQSEGGFGLYIIRSLFDEVTYGHDDGVNRIELRRFTGGGRGALPPASAAPAPALADA